MLIETEHSLYEIFFQHAQIEISGICNMRCQHCRAWNEARVNMPLGIVETILDFAITNAERDFRLTVSGGEPFIHPSLVEIVRMAKDKGIENIIITTNGSLVTDQKIAKLEAIGVSNLCIQVSIDSVNPQRHDVFRGFRGAFDRAIDCLKRIASSSLKSSLRATLTPATLNEISQLAGLARSCGAIRVGIGSVIPAGKGAMNLKLQMNPPQKLRFIKNLASCKKKFFDIDVTTEDPLKFASGDTVWKYGDTDYTNETFFGGCTAGITGFNADSEGTITPCAVLLKPIVNVQNRGIDDVLASYVQSDIIRSLVARDYKGKCGTCELKRLCGGCRAVANGANGDFLSSDITCWK